MSAKNGAQFEGACPMSYVFFGFGISVFFRASDFGLRILILGVLLLHSECRSETSPYSHWSRGPSTNTAFFPLAVWLQSPANAERYRAAGFNTFVGLWRGPTEEQLAQLKKAGIHLICEQNKTALRHLDEDTIIGWMHGDEPDNAQELDDKSGYGPPVPPERIVESFHRVRAADPSRPVMLNLGQGVAWDQWYGRGSRSNHPEDYPKYVEGCDIVSFDIYPVVHDNKQVAGRLDYVARGVERLIQWTGGKKVVWNCLECTHISNPDRKPTPAEVRSEAWMSIIHGTQGLIYFVHQFKPTFREAALLDDPEMLDAVKNLNTQILQLAPVLHASNVLDLVTTRCQSASDSVATMVKRHEHATYVFAVEMKGQTTSAEFGLKEPVGQSVAEVLGESRSLPVVGNQFSDRFKPWEVHLYRFRDQAVEHK